MFLHRNRRILFAAGSLLNERPLEGIADVSSVVCGPSWVRGDAGMGAGKCLDAGLHADVYRASSPFAADTGGCGTFELNGPINTNGNHTYSLSELSMTVDGLNFSLAQDTSATVSFNNGAFSGLSFDGTDRTGLFKIDTLGTSGTSYDLVQDLFGGTLSQGSISAVDPPSSTPPPPTVLLFGGALLLMGAFAWLRRAPSPRILTSPQV